MTKSWTEKMEQQQAEIDSLKAENERLKKFGAAALRQGRDDANAIVDLENIVDRLKAENERLRQALRIIAGEQQCADNLMSNVDVALAALSQESKP